MSSFNQKKTIERTIIWFRNDLRISDNPVLTSVSSYLKSFNKKQSVTKILVIIAVFIHPSISYDNNK